MSTDVETLALRIIKLAQAGHFTEIWKLFPPALRVMVSAQALERAWTTEATSADPVRVSVRR